MSWLPLFRCLAWGEEAKSFYTGEEAKESEARGRYGGNMEKRQQGENLETKCNLRPNLETLWRGKYRSTNIVTLAY